MIHASVFQTLITNTRPHGAGIVLNLEAEGTLVVAAGFDGGKTYVPSNASVNDLIPAGSPSDPLVITAFCSDSSYYLP